MQLNSLLLRTDFEDRGQKVLSICKENNDTRGHYTEATVTKKQNSDGRFLHGYCKGLLLSVLLLFLFLMYCITSPRKFSVNPKSREQRLFSTPGSTDVPKCCYRD